MLSIFTPRHKLLVNLHIISIAACILIRIVGSMLTSLLILQLTLHGLHLSTQQNADSLEGPKGITNEDIEEAFGELDQCSADASPLDPAIEGHEIDAAKEYDFDELEWVNKGLVPTVFEVEVVVVVCNGSG
jgi:hypothetical protein